LNEIRLVDPVPRPIEPHEREKSGREDASKDQIVIAAAETGSNQGETRKSGHQTEDHDRTEGRLESVDHGIRPERRHGLKHHSFSWCGGLPLTLDLRTRGTGPEHENRGRRAERTCPVGFAPTSHERSLCEQKESILSTTEIPPSNEKDSLLPATDPVDRRTVLRSCGILIGNAGKRESRLSCG